MKGSKWGLVLVVLLVIVAVILYVKFVKGSAPNPASDAGAPAASAQPAAKAAAPEGMVALPGGMYWMGCAPTDKECVENEKPRHQVTLKPFSIDKNEVTQAQYQEAIGSNPSAFKDCANCPVEQVAYADAQAYCQKIGKRLPTEAEWEYAARGGKDGEVRPGNLDDISVTAGDKTYPVGQKLANGFGIFDVLGNVAEWCSDWYGDKYYTNSPNANPTGPESGDWRVLRGGCWNYTSNLVRTSARAGDAPETKTNFIGFRCAKD